MAASTSTRAVDRVQAARQNLEQGQAPDQPGKSIYEIVESYESMFARALPAHVGAKRFLNIAVTELKTNPKLAECTPRSIVAGLMQAANLGLEVTGVRGQAYLIPRWNKRANGGKGAWEATFQIGKNGFVDMAGRGGLLVRARTVKAQDTIEVHDGTVAPADQILHRRPVTGLRGDSIGYYAVVIDKATGQAVGAEYWSKEEVEEHRDKFASTRDRETKEIYGTWVDHFDAMAEKTVIKSLLGSMPLPAELLDAMRQEDGGTVIDVGAAVMAEAPAALPEAEPEADEVIEATATETEAAPS